MKKTSILFLFLLQFISGFAQYITNKGNYLEGTRYISTSRIEAYNSRFQYAGTASISMDYVHMSGASHSMKDGDYFTIQMNFYERSIGQTVLLKCKSGKVIELSTKSIQREPFVQIYWLRENDILDIINGEVVKVRILTNNGFVDRDIKNNTFSKAISKCYYILKKEIRENNVDDMYKLFRDF